MKPPILLVLNGDEFRTPELERALQLKGWEARWVNASSGGTNGGDGREEDLLPSVLVAPSGRVDDSLQSIRSFRSRNSFMPLILIGGNAVGFPVSVDALILRGDAPDQWLAALEPLWPDALPQEAQAGDIGELFGKYRLVKKIATGGTAEIFQAEQTEPEGFNRILAIKRMLPQHQGNPKYVKMFLEEANLGVILEHNNIVRVIDVGCESGAYYLAMEYVDGGTISGLIDKAKGIGFPEPVAAFIINQVAEALDYIHRKRDGHGQSLNLAHRDISPQNILVAREGTVKITDFGIAKTAGQEMAQAHETTLHGKLLYMSPEQAMGSHIDHRSDIYSVGLVLFEMLTGEPCYQQDEQLGLFEKVRVGMIRDISEARPDTSKPMARIVNRMLQKNLSDRYRSAQSLARDLAAYLNYTNYVAIESDVRAFVRLLYSAMPQAKAFAASRFSPIKGNFALPSETGKESNNLMSVPAGTKWIGYKQRPVWALQTVNALLILLAYLLWLSMNV